MSRNLVTSISVKLCAIECTKANDMIKYENGDRVHGERGEGKGRGI